MKRLEQPPISNGALEFEGFGREVVLGIRAAKNADGRLQVADESAIAILAAEVVRRGIELRDGFGDGRELREREIFLLLGLVPREIGLSAEKSSEVLYLIQWHLERHC